MTWLLRFFPQFVRLEVRCAAQAEHIRLVEDKALAAESRAEDVRKVADAAWRTLTGRTIFGTASEAMPLPPGWESPDPVTSNFKSSRQRQAEAEAAAEENLKKFYENEMAQ